jgi:RNA polymerase sigma factor (sigma-70 family)
MLNGPQKAVLPHLHRLLGSGSAAGLTDRQLLEHVLRRRDPAAFAALVRRHGRTVLSVCQRVLDNPHDAEDAFQATFLVLFRKARSIANRDAVGSWLYGVAYRVALKARAEAGRRRKHERQAVDRSDNRRRSDGAGDEWRPILDEEVNRLPEKYRQPIVLCYFEGKTYEEAARLLGWPAGTVSVRLARARKLLGSRLALRGLALGSGALSTMLAEVAASAKGAPVLAEAAVQAIVRMMTETGTADVSAQVVALTEGVVKAMLHRNVKTLAAVLVAISVLGGGAGVLCRFAGTSPASAADPPAQAPVEAGAAPAPAGPAQEPAPEERGAPRVRALAPPAEGARPPQTRVGLINMTRVLKASKRFQAIEAELRTRTQQTQKELETMKARLQKYTTDSTDPTADARRARQLQARMEDKANDAKRVFAERSEKAFVQIYREVEDAANRVAKRDGLELVMFYTDAVTEADFYAPHNLQRKLTQPGVLMPLIVAPGMDITDTIVAVLNGKGAVPEGR